MGHTITCLDDSCVAWLVFMAVLALTLLGCWFSIITWRVLGGSRSVLLAVKRVY